ncbi:MAG TPA: hypothetical protein VER32_06285 [Pyrinomonadaceae bacterium]|nr:hypothetical protein [Pyrinomonadaceae bacterium]
MSQLGKFREALATYRRHGWRLARVLMTDGTLAELRLESAAGGGGADVVEFEGARVEASDFDAMWLARQSHGGREAWELRLVAETPYALFELFEADEEEEDRADVRREMEARMREYLSPPAETSESVS